MGNIRARWHCRSTQDNTLRYSRSRAQHTSGKHKDGYHSTDLQWPPQQEVGHRKWNHEEANWCCILEKRSGFQSDSWHSVFRFLSMKRKLLPSVKQISQVSCCFPLYTGQHLQNEMSHIVLKDRDELVFIFVMLFYPSQTWLLCGHNDSKKVGIVFHR